MVDKKKAELVLTIWNGDKRVTVKTKSRKVALEIRDQINASGEDFSASVQLIKELD